MTSSATSGRLQIAFMPPLPSPTSLSQNDLSWNILESTKAITFKIYHRVAIDRHYLYFDQKWRHRHEVGSKSHKRVHFGSCSGRDFLIAFQKMSKRFKVLKSVIHLPHFLFCGPLDIFAPWPRNVAQVGLPSSTHYTNGYFRFIVAFKSHTQVRPYAHWQTFSEQVIASILYDGRFEMKVVAFRNAPPNGGLSCYMTYLPFSVHMLIGVDHGIWGS